MDNLDLGIDIPEFLVDTITIDEGPDGVRLSITYAYAAELIGEFASTMHSSSIVLNEATDPDGRLMQLFREMKDNAEEIINEQASYLRANQ